MTLQDFFNDKELMTDVQNYLDKFLEDEAVRLLFEADRNEVDNDYLRALSMTKEGLKSAFFNLEVVFQTKDTPKVVNNPAR